MKNQSSFDDEITCPLYFNEEDTAPCKLDKPYSLFMDGTSSAEEQWEI